MKYALPILFRYASLVLQFLVVVLVARRLTQAEAGIYLQAFGVINATYFMFGLGLPDGLVRFVAHADAADRRDEVRSMVRRATLFAVVPAIAIPAIGIGAAYWFGGGTLSLTVVLATAAWWMCYGVTFFASQVLVASSRQSLGAFFFYPAMNIALFVTSVPYLLFATAPDIEATLIAAVCGGILCALAAAGAAVRAFLHYPQSTIDAPIGPVFRLGAVIGVSRVLQSFIYWIPVWAVGFWHGASDAALFGTASRLNVAIAAVMAAVRFTIRPTIVRFAVNGDWTGLGREARAVATAATVMAIIAIAGTVTVGPFAIGLVFGEAYRPAAWILAVLLIGTLGECIGGAVDEVLKMTGNANTVIAVLVLVVGIEAVAVWLASAGGLMAAALAQAGAFVGMYALMLGLVKWRRGVWVGASPSRDVLRFLPRRRSGD